MYKCADLTALVIKDRAYAIHADLKFRIRPEACEAGIKWLTLAYKWAVKHNRSELKNMVGKYLADYIVQDKTLKFEDIPVLKGGSYAPEYSN